MASSPPSLDNPSSIPETEARTSDFIEGKVDGEPVLITDPDLIEQVKTAPPSMRSVIIRMASRTQDERNKTQERRESMTPIQRRRDVVRETIAESLLDKTDIYHIHSVLALCGLPYKRPPSDFREYDIKYGHMSLSVEAGRLMDPQSGDWVRQGLPYGPKARLMQLHICTKALRQKSPVVELEGSMSAFIRSLGFKVQGGPRGTIQPFKEQLNRLAACTMRVGLWDGKNHSKTIKLEPIESFEVWFPDDPDQKMLWPSKIVLNQKFYDSLIQHALPVDMRSLSVLSHSARQMDLLLWLSYRLKELNKSYFLSWELMKAQFCQSKDRRMIDFQRQFKQDLKDIEEVFDKVLPVQAGDAGLLLKPCNPEGLFVQPIRK
jgi:hypothetical protein